MKLCKALIWSHLALVTGYSAPVNADTYSFTVNGAAFLRDSTNGRSYIRGVSADSHRVYGTIDSNVPGWDAYLGGGYVPMADWAARVGSNGDIEIATATIESAPPGASCPWPNAPGARWMPGTWGPYINWDVPIIPNIYLDIERTRGQHAFSGGAYGFSGPLRGCYDNWFQWAAIFDALDGVTFHYAMGVPATQTAYLTLDRVYQSEPFLYGGGDAWVLSERCDFTITIFDSEPPCSDVNLNGTVEVADLMAFLGAWFAGDPAGDWDASGGCEVADIFAYLTDFFGST